MTCERSIRFIVPGGLDSPDLEVYAVEQDDGTIRFEISVVGDLDADIRGLFFDISDPALIGGLALAGTDITTTGFGNVIDLGKGNNMKGGGRDPYDVGVSFGTQGIGKGDDIQATSFVLSSTDGSPLTLDLIANVEFGARLTSVEDADGYRTGSAKNTVIAPAAPDAIDDSYNIFEDGQSGLEDPSTVPEAVQFEVLLNDTDADGDRLDIPTSSAR